MRIRSCGAMRSDILSFARTPHATLAHDAAMRSSPPRTRTHTLQGTRGKPSVDHNYSPPADAPFAAIAPPNTAATCTSINKRRAGTSPRPPPRTAERARVIVDPHRARRVRLRPPYTQTHTHAFKTRAPTRTRGPNLHCRCRCTRARGTTQCCLHRPRTARADSEHHKGLHATHTAERSLRSSAHTHTRACDKRHAPCSA
jgi:hypothetical protein